MCVRGWMGWLDMMQQLSRRVLRVIRGNPTAEELAALVTVIAARARQQAAAGARGGPPAPSAWADRARLVRRPLYPGPGAWRASNWPD